MADILSNSWGLGPGNCSLVGVGFDNIIDAYDNAITGGRNGLGSVVVFSSGNHGSCISFPRNINGAITVGAIRNNGQILNYSNTGPEMDLGAPSGNIGLNGDVRTKQGKVGGENTTSTISPYTVRIYRDDGGLAWEKETAKPEETIPTASWKEGIYHVHIHHAEGVFNQKVIIRH